MGDSIAVVQIKLGPGHGFDIGLQVEQGPFDRAIGPGGHDCGTARQGLAVGGADLELVGGAQRAPSKGYAGGQGPVAAADAGWLADLCLYNGHKLCWSPVSQDTMKKGERAMFRTPDIHKKKIR